MSPKRDPTMEGRSWAPIVSETPSFRDAYQGVNWQCWYSLARPIVSILHSLNQPYMFVFPGVRILCQMSMCGQVGLYNSALKALLGGMEHCSVSSAA